MIAAHGMRTNLVGYGMKASTKYMGYYGIMIYKIVGTCVHCHGA